jgi:hypothetical protein
MITEITQRDIENIDIDKEIERDVKVSQPNLLHQYALLFEMDRPIYTTKHITKT